jgi:hypothetical protein
MRPRRRGSRIQPKLPDGEYEGAVSATMKRAFFAIFVLVGVCAAQTAADPPLRIGSVDVCGLINKRFEAWKLFPCRQRAGH